MNDDVNEVKVKKYRQSQLLKEKSNFQEHSSVFIKHPRYNLNVNVYYLVRWMKYKQVVQPAMWPPQYASRDFAQCSANRE